MSSAVKLAFRKKNGFSYNGKIEDFLDSHYKKKYEGRVNLIFTSPPFPLNRKKKYGNLQGEEYIRWLANVCTDLKDLLADDGSFVIEVGNSWAPKMPVMSTLSLEALLNIHKQTGMHLCQQFISYNTAKLPSPAQWVTVERIRLKDSFTHIWWFSKSPKPKANNKNVLVEYSSSMKKLLQNKKYNSGRRPSEHNIGGASFLNDNRGAIPSNVLVSSNTQSSNPYLEYCKTQKIEPHPARMPIDIPIFFIKLLTSEGDLVFDPFGGSNTTGEAAVRTKRKWVSVEPNEEYIIGSKGRFL